MPPADFYLGYSMGLGFRLLYGLLYGFRVEGLGFFMGYYMGLGVRV